MPSLSPAELWRATNRGPNGQGAAKTPETDTAKAILLRTNPRGSHYSPDRLPEDTVLQAALLVAVPGDEEVFGMSPDPALVFSAAESFYMKDMYTFSLLPEAAQLTYSLVCDAYSSLFNRLGPRCVKVQADVGSIGVPRSHEVPAASGHRSDRALYSGPSCHFSANGDSGLAHGQTAQACQGPLT